MKPIDQFLSEANSHSANFPVDALCANLLAMPWIELMDKFENLELLPPHQTCSLIGDVKPALVRQALAMQQIGS